ncbi:MAG: ABC transporter permease [Ruminococcus sp.]|uniref:ABC transporter permease n=1 Tax=Ruminococcus sp. TaxID=41978 RepID=UPI0025D0FCCB|nr:ABC transporter permease [Ruminococcus sp.]MCR5600723.1 ABC transporter permease [Ruminococcus sp.]
MQVFKAMFKVTKKRLPSVLAYMLVFLFISFVHARSATKDNKFEANRLKICVFDEDDTPESHALIDFIGKSNNLKTIENDRDVIIDSLYYGRVDYALIINKGYAKKLSAGETDDLFGSYHMDENYSVVYMGQLLDEYTTSVKAYITMGKTIDEAISSAEEALSQHTEVSMLRLDKGGDSHYSVDFAQYFEFMVYILISAVMIVVCQVLVTMNRKDIRFRTNCSCIKESKYTFQLFFGSCLFVLAMWLVLMIFGIILNKEMYAGRAWYAVLNSLIFAAVTATIAVFVASFEPKENVLNLITQVLGLGMCFICGVFVPISVLGEGVLAVARFMPAYWYVKANNMIAETEPYSLSGVLQCYAIQTLFAVAMIVLSVLVRKVKYSSAAIGTSVKKIAVHQ